MLWADEGDGKHGEVSFRQISPINPVLVNINATGLPKGKHAVHIHAYGDMRERCKSTGPHVRGILVCHRLHTEESFIYTYINTQHANSYGSLQRLPFESVGIARSILNSNQMLQNGIPFDF